MVRKLPSVVCIGSSVLDFESITSEELKHDGGSYAGRVVQRCGGTSRNHAEAIGRLLGAAGCDSTSVTLLSAVGVDANGDHLMRETAKYADVSRVHRSTTASTATHMSMNQRGNILFGISYFEAILKEITPEYISANADVLASADFIFCDANLPLPTLSRVLEIAKENKIKVWFEPTEISIAHKFLNSTTPSAVSVISPNISEFIAILSRLGVEADESSLDSPSALLAFLLILPPLFPHLDMLMVTLDQRGSLLITKELVAEKYKVSQYTWGIAHILPPPTIDEIVSVSGAGDNLNSALLVSLLLGRSLEDSIDLALQAVAYTLGSTDAIAEELSQMNIAHALTNTCPKSS